MESPLSHLEHTAVVEAMDSHINAGLALNYLSLFRFQVNPLLCGKEKNKFLLKLIDDLSVSVLISSISR